MPDRDLGQSHSTGRPQRGTDDSGVVSEPGGLDGCSRLQQWQKGFVVLADAAADNEKIRPQQIHQLLAIKPLMRGQGQQLDDRRRLASSPRRVLYLALAYADAETPQELDAQILAMARWRFG